MWVSVPLPPRNTGTHTSLLSQAGIKSEVMVMMVRYVIKIEKEVKDLRKENKDLRLILGKLLENKRGVKC